MANRELNHREIAARGEEIYEREIRAQLGPESRGKFVVLEIESGEFEIDDDDLTATERLLARKPGAISYGIRVGQRAAYRLGLGRIW
jgi:translation initiation factor RLI1